MMKSEILQKYINAFSKLNRATVNGIKAPHKPILLLSIIQSISVGEITENRIEITPQLVARFKENWQWLVKEPFFKPNFYLPFFHLHKESFWHLHTKLGKELILTKSGSITSFYQLRECIEYAYFDEPLFDLLTKVSFQHILNNFILDHYFPQAKSYSNNLNLFETLTTQILQDSSIEYKHSIENSDEEEVYIRSGVFKKVVPRIYDYTCCITGLRIVSGYDIQMVDACHIIPFSFSHDDTISNGISLCPNLHRAFDRGLVSIDNELRVMVTEHFVESSNENGIKIYKGKQILLPKDKKYHPSQINLDWHRERIFKD